MLLLLPQRYLLCTGIDMGQHCVYVIRYTAYATLSVPLSADTAVWWCARVELENMRMGRLVGATRTTPPGEPSLKKKKKTYKKYVVSPFEGVITRGDSLYSLDISCAKCFLP